MYQFQFRRSPSYTWVKYNPVLAEGEPGVETDTGRLKIGDGIQSWTALPYFIPGVGPDGGDVELEEHVNSATPHPVYDDGPSLFLLYQNAKV
jgi:hypothetical protein